MGEGATEMSRDDQYDVNARDPETSVDREIDIVDDDTDVEEAAEIRENIEQTRAEMSETINAIQERLSPANLKEQVMEEVREQFQEAKDTVRQATIGKVEDMVQSASNTVYETRRTIVQTIRENPIPAALVGIGLGWLWMNARSNESSRYRSAVGRRGSYGDAYGGAERYREGSVGYGQVGYGSAVPRGDGYAPVSSNYPAGRNEGTGRGTLDRAQEAASSLASTAQEKVSGAVSQAQETATYLADQAQRQTRYAGERLQDALEDNPLAVGAVALALGAAVGFSLPLTNKENQLMGEARDTLVDKAQTLAQDTMQTVQRVAERVTDETKTAIKDETSTHGSPTP
jgi:ElaB/YqjD/DUF883 family membrane-anchored ribosome-binding protein